MPLRSMRAAGFTTSLGKPFGMKPPASGGTLVKGESHVVNPQENEGQKAIYTK